MNAVVAWELKLRYMPVAVIRRRFRLARVQLMLASTSQLTALAFQGCCRCHLRMRGLLGSSGLGARFLAFS